VHPYPHIYEATAHATGSNPVAVESPGLPSLATTPPPQFDGPEGFWSPETLLAASVADCFILTFRAVARGSKFEWSHLECRVEAVLERVDGLSRFTRFITHATLSVPSGSDAEKAKLLLEKAEHGCLIANSLSGVRELRPTITATG
jgi:organic hydroperoxide reductase OsmC/OhrA